MSARQNLLTTGLPERAGSGPDDSQHMDLRHQRYLGKLKVFFIGFRLAHLKW